MRDYQRELEELRERIARRRENSAVLETLRRQEEDCLRQVRECGEQLEREQADVDRLEHVTLSSILAALKGDRDERTEKERAEAYRAQLRLQEAERQLTEIRMEIQDRQDRIQADAECETRYRALLREKEADLRREAPELAARLADLEARELGLTARQRELREAIDAGGRALSQLDTAQKKLDSAGTWGTWDLLGGGLLADAMKYSRLDEAQSALAALKSGLRRYQAELADVARAAEFDVRADGFLYAADVFFDSFFAGLAVQEQIGQSQGQLREVETRIRSLQRRLEADLRQAERELAELRTERDELVRRA